MCESYLVSGALSGRPRPFEKTWVYDMMKYLVLAGLEWEKEQGKIPPNIRRTAIHSVIILLNKNYGLLWIIFGLLELNKKSRIPNKIFLSSKLIFKIEQKK